MGRRNKKNPTPEEELDYLLYDLCVDWGFCNRLSASDLLRKNGQIEADEFASAVLIAEAMTPEYEKKWFRKIKSRFTDKYGSQLSVDGT